MRKALTWLTYIIIPMAIVGLAVLLWGYRNTAMQQSRRLQSLRDEAAPYEAELNKLSKSRDEQERLVLEPEGPGCAVIGYQLSSEEDLELIEKHAERFGFTPVLVLDIQDRNISSLMTAIYGSSSAMKYEIVLTCGEMDDSIPDLIQTAKETLERYRYKDAGAFLLRDSLDSPENRKVLLDAGITRLFLYSNTLNSTAEPEFVSMNYSYISKSGYTPDSRLAELADSEQALIFVVSLDRLADKTISESLITGALQGILNQVNAGTVEFSTVEKAAEAVQTRVEREQARQKAYDDETAATQARIAELRETIDGIYSSWDAPEE